MSNTRFNKCVHVSEPLKIILREIQRSEANAVQVRQNEVSQNVTPALTTNLPFDIMESTDE
jgi:hypothetical protein